MYCGNNRKDPDIVSGKKTIGERYSCFKKGIGIGLNAPLDKSYKKYSPIYNKKVYCGKAKRKPQGYTVMGNLSDCLQKGVGVGKKLKYDKKYSYKYNNEQPKVARNSEQSLYALSEENNSPQESCNCNPEGNTGLNKGSNEGEYTYNYISRYKNSYRNKYLSKSHFYMKFLKVFLIVSIILGTVLYMTKPDIIMKNELERKNKNNKERNNKEININKYMILLLFTSITISFFYIWLI